MQDLLGLISDARAAIRKQNQDDRIFVELRIREVVAILNEAYREFAVAVPYAVCTTCQGQAPDTCRLCQGRGVISKHRYTSCVPSELKEIRKKATKKSA
jgi:DnaJ-class molecular chaperone